jgi:hypothetical protein
MGTARTLPSFAVSRLIASSCSSCACSSSAAAATRRLRRRRRRRPNRPRRSTSPTAPGRPSARCAPRSPRAPVFAPSVSTLTKGKNRIGFALFDTARKQVVPDAVALYVAQPDGRRLRGPYEARKESLRVKPQFQSRQTQADLDDIDTFWVADVPFPRRGRFVGHRARLGRRRDGLDVAVRDARGTGKDGPPLPGDEAVASDTDTVEDAGGNLAKIDTRIPPLPDLHEKSFADIVGKEPAVLAFATPQLCQTRVCGPVADVVLEVASQNEDVTFIHQEVYKDNDIQQGFREQIAEWRLPTEPWVFVVGRDGKVTERFEGAVSVRELAGAVAAAQAAG